MAQDYAAELHSDPLVEVLALLDRLEASGEDFDPDMIRAHVPADVRERLASEVARVNEQLRMAGY